MGWKYIKAIIFQQFQLEEIVCNIRPLHFDVARFKA